MNLRKSIKRVASFLRVGVDFERLKIMYQENPEDIELRKAQFIECKRRNENPEIYIKWVKDRYDLDINLDDERWNLSNKSIKDFKFLSGVNGPNLKELSLSRNEIKSLKGLSKLNAPNLRELYLGGNQIFSLKGLLEFNAPNLERLELDNNPIALTISEKARKRFPFIKV